MIKVLENPQTFHANPQLFRSVRELHCGGEGGDNQPQRGQHPGREHRRQRRLQGVSQVEDSYKTVTGQLIRVKAQLQHNYRTVKGKLN